MTDDQTARHHIVQGLFAAGPASHHETDAEEQGGEVFAEISAQRPPEADLLAMQIDHPQAEQQFSGRGAQPRALENGEIQQAADEADERFDVAWASPAPVAVMADRDSSSAMAMANRLVMSASTRLARTRHQNPA